MNIRNHIGSYLPAVIVSILAMSISVPAHAQQGVESDYEVQKTFKQEYRTINESVDTTGSSKAMQEIIERIKELRDDYSKNRELLNKVLFPKSFDEEIEQLKRKAVLTRQRLVTIENQEERLDKLDEEVASYESRINELNRKTESLQKEIQKSDNSEKQLSGLVEKYRKNLERRDDLILLFIDSLMVSYDMLNISSIKNLERAKKKARLNANGDAVKMIETIVRENINLLESNHRLATEEYLRMYVVQQNFEDMWRKVGAELVNIYSGDNKKNIEAEVEKNIDEWGRMITDRTWNSLNESLAEAEIQIREVTDQQTFYKGLENYLDSAITKSREQGSEKQYADYQNFNDFWTTTVKMKWTEHVEEGGILSNRQMASIDQKLDRWSEYAEPESNFLVYLLGASVLAVVVLGVMLAKEKGKNSQ